MIICTHLSVWSYQNTNVLIILVGFQKDIAHITVSKALAKLEKEVVIAALLSGFLNAYECILCMYLMSNYTHTVQTHMYSVSVMHITSYKTVFRALNNYGRASCGNS